MKSFKKLIIALLLLSSSAIFAQQESIFTFYRYQMNIVNPAYVGVDDKTIISSGIRNQWTGIEDAPETQAVAFGTSLGKNTGLGLSMVRDKTFIEKQSFFGLDFSYKLKVTESTNLFLGIKAGGNFYDVNTAGLQTYNLMGDPALNSINSLALMLVSEH
jgi:type IX secretion system PorP/SprF family membrane protein